MQVSLTTLLLVIELGFFFVLTQRCDRSGALRGRIRSIPRWHGLCGAGDHNGQTSALIRS